MRSSSLQDPHRSGVDISLTPHSALYARQISASESLECGNLSYEHDNARLDTVSAPDGHVDAIEFAASSEVKSEV